MPQPHLISPQMPNQDKIDYVHGTLFPLWFLGGVLFSFVIKVFLVLIWVWLLCPLPLTGHLMSSGSCYLVSRRLVQSSKCPLVGLTHLHMEFRRAALSQGWRNVLRGGKALAVSLTIACCRRFFPLGMIDPRRSCQQHVLQDFFWEFILKSSIQLLASCCICRSCSCPPRLW